jgi:Neuraminidase (sialidase)
MNPKKPDNSSKIWSDLQPLSEDGAIGSPGGSHPLVTDGNVVRVVWAQRGRIHYRVSTDAGRTWGHASPLTSGTTAQYPCSLELSGSTLHLIWPDSRNGKWELYYKRSTDGGDTWEADTQLTPGMDLFRLGTAISGSVIHVAWGSRSCAIQTDVGLHTWGEIYYKRSIDNGETWEPTIRLTEPDGSAMRPGIAAWDKYVYVNWFDRRDSKCVWDWDIYCKRSIDGGATWEGDIRMNDTPYHSRHPQMITTSGGRVCCLWEDGQYHDGKNWLGDAALYVSLSDDQGQTWTRSKRITFVNAPNAWATHPKTYASGSRVHLVWTDSPEGPHGPQAAYYMTSPDGGATWENPEQIAIATEANPHDVHGQGVAGTETYAVALISESGGLHYRRRDLAMNPGTTL